MIYWSILGYGALFRGIWWWAAPPIIITIIIFTALYLISTSIAEKIEPRLRWIR
jgi:peptide/nickel transport system permease protein